MEDKAETCRTRTDGVGGQGGVGKGDWSCRRSGQGRGGRSRENVCRRNRVCKVREQVQETEAGRAGPGGPEGSRWRKSSGRSIGGVPVMQGLLGHVSEF